MNIPFNKPHLTGKEAHYMYQAVYNGKLSGNGEFTKYALQKEFLSVRYCLGLAGAIGVMGAYVIITGIALYAKE